MNIVAKSLVFQTETVCVTTVTGIIAREQNLGFFFRSQTVELIELEGVKSYLVKLDFQTIG